MNIPTTPVADPFVWQPSPAGAVLASHRIEPLAAHLFTTRQLGFRPDIIERDYERLAECFAVESAAVVRVRQVHGRQVVVVRAGEEIDDNTPADAIVSVDPARVVSVRIADCVPILIADRGRRVVAAVHAGWRGTAAGVATATVDAIEALGVSPKNLVAAIGPAIGPCCYQVDAVVRDEFIAAGHPVAECFVPDGAAHWRADLWRANLEQLVKAGVPETSVAVAGLCTAHLPDVFHSHRRDGAAAGRMVAAIRLPGPGESQ